MTLNIIIILYSLFLPFIMMLKSLILGDLPGFFSTSISSCTLVSAILDMWESQLFFSLVIEASNKKSDITIMFSFKTTFRKALLTNKCANFIKKNYEKKLNLLRQNGITSCFFSNLNCFLLIIHTLNQNLTLPSSSASKTTFRTTGFNKNYAILKKLKNYISYIYIHI